jgi:hypothetical protein
MEQARSTSRTDRIRQLNDAHRANIPASTVFITSGIASLTPEAQHAIIHAVRTFDAFTLDNDPWKEHDFGSFKFDGMTIYWKFDYYDLDGMHGAEDSSNPTVTRRVLTILLADEY